MIFKIFTTLSLWLTESVHHPIRRLQLALGALVLLVAYATVGYMLIERMPPLDALFMTVITITTIGYGEVVPLSPTGRAFTITVIAIGVVTATAAISEAIRVTLEPVLWQSIQRRRMEQKRMKMSQHYIVCGFGRVGRQVVRDLTARRASFIVVDQTADSEDWFLKQHIPYVIGDATREETLAQAQIATARGLVSVLANDADNIMTVLTARMLSPTLKIIARVVRPESEQKLRAVGADDIINPYQIGGHRIALSLLRPAVNQFLHHIFHFEDARDTDIGQITLRADTPLVGQRVSECGLRERSLMLLAIVRSDAEMQISPPATHTLAVGDQLVIIGPSAEVYRLEQEYA